MLYVNLSTGMHTAVCLRFIGTSFSSWIGSAPCQPESRYKGQPRFPDRLGHRYGPRRADAIPQLLQFLSTRSDVRTSRKPSPGAYGNRTHSMMSSGCDMNVSASSPLSKFSSFCIPASAPGLPQLNLILFCVERNCGDGILLQLRCAYLSRANVSRLPSAASPAWSPGNDGRWKMLFL